MAASKSPEQIRAEAEAAEYSTWRAVVPIMYGDQVAYQPGHPVPVSNVAAYKYDQQGLVERVRGDERQQAIAANPATNTTGPVAE